MIMEFYLFCLIILGFLAIFDLMVGVSNDAVNFLNSSFGSKVAPVRTIMIVASLGILAGVTFSSGMMEVARKGIFYPRYFLMSELIIIFLAVMLADVLLLDMFNTFGMPTSTTVSIVFELLGAAVAVSLFKIMSQGENLADLVRYINTAKALAIIMGILLSVVVAFLAGVIAQFLTRLVFTFDYTPRLKRYGALWGGIALSIITYFILIKGAKGASFLTPETISWIKKHTMLILFFNFLVFGITFHFITLFTRINILKPIVLVGTFSLAMAFAANDLVNFIGVPMAGLNAYQVASSLQEPLKATMEALEKPVQANTLLLLLAGSIMVATLWISRKARTVTRTEVNLARQDIGIERFGSSFFSRVIVGAAWVGIGFMRKVVPVRLRRAIAIRLDSSRTTLMPGPDGTRPSFDLVRASVNLVIASAVISMATSLKLPLSTTYVTFMVAMGTSLADQAWGRESAVYRVTGVITVIGGWFFTALGAVTTSFLFATAIYFFELPAILGLIGLVSFTLFASYRYHLRKEQEKQKMEALTALESADPQTSITMTFEQTGQFLREISDNVDLCFDAAFAEDLERLRSSKAQVEKIETMASLIVGNIFSAISMLHKEDLSKTAQYAKTTGVIQSIAGCHRDIISHTCKHFENYLPGFEEEQKDELRHVKAFVTRLLWNTAIMLMRRKRVDFDYIENQYGRLKELIESYDKNQVVRIQRGESKPKVTLLYYALLENCLRLTEDTKELLIVFRDSLGLGDK